MSHESLRLIFLKQVLLLTSRTLLVAILEYALVSAKAFEPVYVSPSRFTNRFQISLIFRLLSALNLRF